MDALGCACPGVSLAWECGPSPYMLGSTAPDGLPRIKGRNGAMCRTKTQSESTHRACHLERLVNDGPANIWDEWQFQRLPGL